jgi:hypothetical protein
VSAGHHLTPLFPGAPELLRSAALCQSHGTTGSTSISSRLQRVLKKHRSGDGTNLDRAKVWLYSLEHVVRTCPVLAAAQGVASCRIRSTPASSLPLHLDSGCLASPLVAEVISPGRWAPINKGRRALDTTVPLTWTGLFTRSVVGLDSERISLSRPEIWSFLFCDTRGVFLLHQARQLERPHRAYLADSSSRENTWVRDREGHQINPG